MPMAMRVSPEAMRASASRRSLAVRQTRHELGRRERADQPRRGLGVLRGQRLRRRQEHALQPGLRGADQAVQGDDRLARADVALQQAPHGRLTAQVGLELVERLELVRRELEGQAVEEGAAEVARRRQRRRLHALLLLLLVQQQPDLHQQQFLEHQALAGQLSPPRACAAGARP